MSTPPETGDTFEVVCPHCRKSFEAAVLGGSTERNTGFKCSHCRLFVPWKTAEERELAEPADGG